MLEAAVTAPFTLEACSTELCIALTPSLTSLESWSIASFACWPPSVSGFPRPFRSLASLSVALLISLVALLRLFSERLPPLSDSPADLTDPDQVVIEVQRLFAQSAAEDESLDP